MENINQRIALLEEKMQSISFKQRRLGDELYSLESELKQLKTLVQNQTVELPTEKLQQELIPPVAFAKPFVQTESLPQRQQSFVKPIPKPSKQLEDFIGTNLISKVGILITVIGVFIGAKYAIDKELISPYMRIVLGYLMAGGLVGFAIKLKNKYENFSAVLMGGGVAVVYFITFIAYSFYNLFPQGVAFALMVLATAFVVYMALWYNQKIIALLGQVGAYAIPFLLSDGTGRVIILCSYITIINIGLLVLAFKKNWKIIYRLAFFITWCIYLVTIILGSSGENTFAIKFTFITINFITFYAAFLAYKIVRKELYDLLEIFLLLFNAFLFFLIGYTLVDDNFSYLLQHQYATTYLTIFTLANAAVHIAAGIWIHKLKLTDNSVYQFMLGLGITFITIAVPIACKQNWITLLWMFEATTLCYVGYKSKRHLYLVAGLLLLALAGISLFIDWQQHYNSIFESGIVNKTVQPFFNFNFLSSILICSCLAIISWWAITTKEKVVGWASNIYSHALPFVFIGLLYISIFLEISLWWYYAIAKRHYLQAENFQILSLQLYSASYVGIWLLLNMQFFKSKYLAAAMMAAAIITIAITLTTGLHVVGDIRQFYLAKHVGNQFWMLGIRYFSFAAVALLLFLIYKNAHQFFASVVTNKLYSSLFNVSLLTIICNEFIHWMDIGGYTNQYKLGLSIICGLYALALIVIGILKKKKHLRMGAIILLTATLLKLFFYDIADLSSISKTIVLIILGVILLVASFLYNKFKSVLFDEDVVEKE